MRAEDIPPQYKEILDRMAGREHSATGAVMQCLAEILTLFQEDLLQEIWDNSEPIDGGSNG